MPSHKETSLASWSLYIGHELHSSHSSYINEKKCPVDKAEFMYKNETCYVVFVL